MKALAALALLLLPQAAGDGWWDAGWKHRRRLTLRNNHDRDLQAGFPLEIQVDAGYLGLAEKAKADFSDLAVVHRGRRLPCLVQAGRDAARPVLLFRSAADLRPGAEDRYELYYGNPQAVPSAPRRADLVDFFEDFSDPAAFGSRFAPDPEVRCAVENGTLLLRDVEGGRTADAPARIELKTGPVPAGFALSFDLVAAGEAAGPMGVSFAVDLKDPRPPAPDLGKKIDELIALLEDDAWESRERATRELIKIGKPALPRLLAASRSGDAEVRWRSEHALREIRERTAPPTIAAGIAAPLALTAVIGKYRPTQAWRGPAPERIRVRLARDPEGDVRITWDGGHRQTGHLEGEVEQIAILVHKAGSTALCRIDNVELRRSLDDESRPTHTLEVEETRP
jgi:hypothetical protein